MPELRIPTVVAVGLWAASGLAVLTYTYIAFKETATDAERILQIAASPLIANEALLAAEGVTSELEKPKPAKPLDRKRFKKSSGQ